MNLSNEKLIEELAKMHDRCMMPEDKALVTETMLRLAKNDERDRQLVHIVPETLLLSFVEASTPNKRLTVGDMYKIVQGALEMTDEAITQGRLTHMMENAKCIEEARTKAAKEVEAATGGLKELLDMMKG